MIRLWKDFVVLISMIIYESLGGVLNTKYRRIYFTQSHF